MHYLCIMKQKVEYFKVIFGIIVCLLLLLIVVINKGKKLQNINYQYIAKFCFSNSPCYFLVSCLVFCCSSLVISLLFFTCFYKFNHPQKLATNHHPLTTFVKSLSPKFVCEWFSLYHPCTRFLCCRYPAKKTL